MQTFKSQTIFPFHDIKAHHQVTCFTITLSTQGEALPSTVGAQLSEIPADRRQRAAAGTGYRALYTCAVPAVPGLQ